jgi:hypothetical protein
MLSGSTPAISSMLRTVITLDLLPTSVISVFVEAMQPKSGGSVYEAVAGVITDLVADGWSATQLDQGLPRWTLHVCITRRGQQEVLKIQREEGQTCPTTRLS